MKTTRLKIIKILSATLVALVLLSGCIVHKIDIQQGNVITQKQISGLTVGMSKREVRYLLGTPLVVDPFHTNRWDYYYSFKEGHSKEVEKRRITVVFEDDKLARIDGDVDSAQKQLPEDEAQESAGTKIDKPTQKKKGFFKRTWDRIWD